MAQRKIVISISAAALLLAVLLFIAAYHISSTHAARNRLDEETAALKARTEDLKNQNDELRTQISDIEAELSTKDTINNYYMEYKKTHDDLTSEVEDLKNQLSELDSEISARQAALEGTAGVSEGKRGQSYPLHSGETYTCPDSVPEGRYSAEGHGTITVINSSGRARLSQNLDVAYGNTYTFNLYAKEKIKVTGETTLTELK